MNVRAIPSGAEARVLRLVGLGVRARNAVVGVERVRQAAQRGRLRLGIVASDASPHSLEKIVPLLAARRIPLLAASEGARLGAAVGRSSTAAIGIVDPDLARGIGDAAAGVARNG
ncbi:MAG TPA: ribosomal L7Ae/L30e/S12e/Gadd45 family protein [Gemmatimonadaceae bacterium]|nr:ribosomal L7Ae/L30e/S12e/Gadd45 family protein [Gemmatimonadaceae bacterium]